jgi:23S rRNA (guanosine2251-2'-O)-methyltransferase
LIIYGRNPVKELLRNNPSKVLCIYINKSTRKSFISDLLEISRHNNLKVELIDNRELDKICSSSKHQGIAASVEEFQYSTIREILDELSKQDKNKLIIILNHIEDPQNLGAIIRSVDVLGGDAVIIPKDRSASVTPAVVKSSAGAVNFVPIAREVNLSNVIKTLKKTGFWVVSKFREKYKRSEI